MPQLDRLPSRWREEMIAVAHVLPFRVNSYVLDQLIDWERIAEDPIFQLTFPQPDMLEPEQRHRVSAALTGGNKQTIRETIWLVRAELNPHPEGQMTHNVPMLADEPVPGVQHKYAETCLVFPSVGQSCHAFCTYCFRWAQFVGDRDLKFATDREMRYLAYLREHDEISDVLLTGGDPMTIRAEILACYIEPLLGAEYDHIQTIRIGTKMLSYWPERVLSDDDADELLGLLSRVVSAGKQVAVMAHFSHPRELETEAMRRAVARLQATGAVIRAQAPLIRHVNDDAETWATMWQAQVRLGIAPYYMFVERDTGSQRYFSVPLARAVKIHRHATPRSPDSRGPRGGR